MYTIKVGIRQGNGDCLERHVVSGGKVKLAQGERLVLFAESENVEVAPGEHGEYTVRLKGGGELVVASAASVPEPGMMGPEAKEPMIVFAPQAAADGSDVHVGEPLSIHQASVADTGFLRRDVGEDFGLNQLLEMASFSAESGDGLAAGKSSVFQDWEEPAPVMSDDDGGEAVNAFPVVEGPVDLGSMNEDGSLVITSAELLAQASDMDGDALSVTELTLASGSGVLTDNGDGTWTFTPAADWHGSVSLDYTVSDGHGGTVPATAGLTVDPVNDAPVVAGDADLGSMNEDGSVVITSAELLAQASDMDGDALSVTGLTLASGSGVLTDNGDGTWTFTPAADWHGSVSLDYTVSDGHGGTAPATAGLTVDPVNDAPVVAGAVDLGSMHEDGSLTVTAAELLAHASDIDGDTLSVTGLTVASGSGVLTDNGDGTWTFAPTTDWHGPVSFDYTVSDGQGGTAPATAALTVDPVNDAPVVEVNSILLVDDLTAQSLAGSLSTTDVDNGATELWYTVTQGPVSGVLLLDGVALTDFSQPVFTQADIDNGRVSFRFDTPQPGDELRVIEDDSFVFTVGDGSLRTAETTFSIRNSAVQVWGTDGDDDLTGAADFSREGVTFHVFGFGGNDTMRGGSGADTLDGGGQSYAVNWLYTQDGGDTVDYGASTAAVDIDLTRATQIGGHAEGDALIGVENVIGSAYNDSIVGDGAANLLVGLGGDDTLTGGAGNDTLRGGVGVDLIDGGVGQDFADYRTSASWVAVDLNIQDGLTAQSGGGADNDAIGDTLVGIENLVGSNDAAHGDVLTGNSGNNHLIGLDGDDTLIGNAGNDTFVGGAGADRQDGGTGTRDLADYSASTAWVNVDLTKQDGTTAQTGGGAGNHAGGDILTGIEDVNGSAHDDSILGSTSSNVLYSYGGNDTISGGAGYDTINAGTGDDWIDGGAHADSIFGGSGTDTIYGGNGIDTLWGGDGDDYLVGGNSSGPNDTSQDLLIAGAGNDTLVATSGLTARDTLVGCQGVDLIIGDGDSSVSYEITGSGDWYAVNYGQTVYVDLRIQDGVTAQSGGSEGNDAVGDIITGIRHAVGAYGIAGDTLIGNAEGNEFYGLDGHDLLIGNEGNDSLWGNDHNDTLEGGAGADLLWGGSEFDVVSYANATQGVNIDRRNMGPASAAVQSGAPGGEENGDEIWYCDGAIGSNHDDTLIATNNAYDIYITINNLLEGRGGDDILAGLRGNDTLDGGEGRDTADYSYSSSAVNVDLNLQDGTTAQSGGGTDNDAVGDVLISIENIVGSAHVDTLLGDGEANVLSGMAGDDSLIGGGGDDTLIGGAGSDTFQGGEGGDLIHAGAGDVVDGGAGSDTLVSEDEYLDVTSSTTITGIERIDLTGVGKELTVGGDAILLNGVADPAGSGFMALVVNGDAGDSVVRLIDGGWTWTLVAGDATVGGDGLTYTLYEASKAGQTVRLYMEAGLNEIERAGGVYQVLGTEGHDDLSTVWDFTDSRHPFNIQGFGGADTLLGGPGADTLAGGAGSDLMDGGVGDDMASYSASLTWVNVDLNLRDGVTAQSGGGADNHAAGDTLLGFEGIIGSNDAAHGDALTGDGQSNLLVGLDGDDSLAGGAGNDTLVGGLGYDTLVGGDGDDWFVDGVGFYDNTYTGDSLVGGDGIDTVDYSQSLDVCMVDLTNLWYSFPNSPYSDAYCDTLVGIENIVGSQWFDSLLGDDGANMISGEGGWDYILGRGGADTLLGGADNDTIYGGSGNDSIDGGPGNDIIDGGDGDDLLVGGMTDAIDAGAGFDTFRLEDNVGMGSVLHLTDWTPSGRVTNVEAVDISGDADDANTLTLTASDVLDTTGGADTLWVRGDADDTVTATDSGWTLVGSEAGADGQQYNHYAGYAGATLVNLMIDTDIAVQDIVHP